MLVYDFQAKRVIAKLSVEEEDITRFKVHLHAAKLLVYSVSSLQVLRKHSLEFDAPLDSGARSESPTLVEKAEGGELRLVKFKPTEMQMDVFGKFLVLVDGAGKLKIILTRNFKTVREGKVGFGPVKTRLFKNFVLSLSKDRQLSVFDAKNNKKHRVVDLTKYAGIDTQYFEFLVLDDKMR